MIFSPPQHFTLELFKVFYSDTANDFTFHRQRAQTSTSTFLPESCRLERSARSFAANVERERARELFRVFFVVAWLKCNRLGLYCLRNVHIFSDFSDPFSGLAIFSHVQRTARLDRHMHERESHQRLCVGLVIARNLKPTFLSSFIFFFVVIANWIFFLLQHRTAGAMLVHPGLLFIEETIFNIFSVFRVYLPDKHSSWMLFVQSDCSYQALRIFYHFK